MSKISHGRVKRLTAEFRGDDAVEFEILEVTLRMAEVARTKPDADTLMVRIAFKALNRVIAEYCSKTGIRYPTYKAVSQYLDEAAGKDAAESNIVSLPSG